ncbi:MAG: tRNA lysidine(34) synthetase TilS [Proteobacteria bacterium]|nr:tRNA lysidine(34) synthetase TilS [Pseudomonadota bacterium]
MNLVNKVKKIIEKERLIEAGDSIIIGVSGGIDSTALVHVLFEISKKIDFKIGLAHLNHQLRGEESVRDEKFVEELAGSLSMPIYIKKADVKRYAKNCGISLQHAGRDLRYAFFKDVLDTHDFNKIAVAHNLDDQAETFLLRMLKGTGIRGLASIPVKRDRIIRPFLGVYRFEIGEYIREHSITYVEDSSNSKTVYERNYIRKRVIPLMEERNPLFKEKIVMLLQDITAINNIYGSKAEDFLKQEQIFEDGDISFEIDSLKEIDEETRFRVFVNTFTKIEPVFIPLREHARLINSVLLSEKPNLMLDMPRGIRIKKVYNRLIFTKKPILPRITDIFPVKSGENWLESLGLMLNVFLQLQDTGIPHLHDRYIARFDGDKIEDLSVRTFLKGDRFVPLGMKNHVKLKDFFISQKIPKEERGHVPLLVSGYDIIWVIGYRIDERFKITEDTKKVLEISAKKIQEHEV